MGSGGPGGDVGTDISQGRNDGDVKDNDDVEGSEFSGGTNLTIVAWSTGGGIDSPRYRTSSDRFRSETAKHAIVE